DFQGYTNDTDAYNEFVSMSNDIEWIKANLKITFTGESIYTEPQDYILPLSSSAYLSESDLDGMSADEVQMAINEIYARHHRKFVIQSIQDYFNARSWYSGTVEAEDFDVSVMNVYEGANINLMVEHLNNAAASSQNISILPASTKDAYGMIIESGSGYFKVRQEDGSVTQFWYDAAKLEGMGLTSDDLKTGAIASLIYDTESYEAINILIF
ncbi:MAG: YARHG domain-containing protein, partial [Lachnospiraceae bacterium]|nr:YARHG domain-containing protein [Lachnospiraceae bacterium]